MFSFVFPVFNSQIASCACYIDYEIAEEAMNFMSYVAEVSRGWDEPNTRDMGSQESIASNGARFGSETEKLWLFEGDCANHERKIGRAHV